MITLEHIPLPVDPALAATEGIHPLSLTLERGDLLWVTGPAGAGKTALLDLLSLRYRPATGHASIMNYDTGPHVSARTRKLLRQRISHIEAEPAFMERLDVADNIALPLELAHFRKGDIQRETGAVLGWFGLKAHARAFPAALSHTMRLRVACARALITRPSIILVDEPALTLCPALRDLLLQTVRDLVQQGAIAVLATQRLPDCMAEGEQVTTLPCRPVPTTPPHAPPCPEDGDLPP